MVGLAAGLMRAWVLFAFLMAAMGFAGVLGLLIGPGIFGSIGNEARQDLAGFGLVFVIFLLFGAFITRAFWLPMSILSSLITVFPMGAFFNWAGGMLLGALFSLVFLSVVLLSLQLYPVSPVGRAISDSSFAGETFAWVDRFTTAMDFTPE